MKKEIIDNRHPSNVCRCLHGINVHGFESYLENNGLNEKMPCKIENCNCINYGNHTLKQFSEFGVSD